MDNNQQFIPHSLLSILPNLTSLSDYCYSEEYNQYMKDIPIKFDSIELFYFVAYNMSLKNLSFKQKVQDLKLFLFLMGINNESQISGSTDQNNLNYPIRIINFYNSIIKNYINAFIQTISQEDFIIDNETKSVLFDLSLLFLQIEKSNFGLNASFDLSLIDVFRKVVNNKTYGVKSNEKTISNNDNNAEVINNNNNSPKDNDNNALTSNKLDNAIQDQIKTEIKLIVMSEIDLKDRKNRKVINNSYYGRKKNVVFNKFKTWKHLGKKSLFIIQKLKKLCKDSYIAQSAYAVFLPLQFYFDESYRLYLIGSGTFGLNKKRLELDHLIMPTYYKDRLFIASIIYWLTGSSGPYKNTSLKLIDDGSNINNSKAVLHMEGTNYVPSDKAIAFTYKIKIIIAKEKYLRCNELLCKMFRKKSTLAKMHIFLEPLLKLYCGAQLAFLILAFFDQKYKIFTRTAKCICCTVPIRKDGASFYLENREYFYYEIDTQNYHRVCTMDYGQLLKQFFNYYHLLYLNKKRRDFEIKMGYLINTKYMFSISRIIDDFKNTSEEYWKKMTNYKKVILNQNSFSYKDLKLYFQYMKKNILTII